MKPLLSGGGRPVYRAIFHVRKGCRLPMKLNRHSKIRDVWRHPLGHDILLQLLHQKGLAVRWLESPLVSGLPLSVLDRYAWPGFSHLVLDLCTQELTAPPPAAPEEEAWWKEAVIYQIFLPSFMDSDHDGVGDLDGVRQRLPYLDKLGAGVLWLRPLLPQSGGGVRDFFCTETEWGDLDAFEALAEAAHLRGMRLLISLDIGGVSEEHPWFQEALRGGEKQGFFLLRNGGPDAPPGGELPPGALSWKYFPEAGLWAKRAGGPQRMVLNWENPQLRETMTGVLRFWLDKGADGFCFGASRHTGRSLGPDDSEGLARWILHHTGTESPRLAPQLHQYLHTLRAGLPEGTLLLGEMRETGLPLAHRMAREGRGGLDMLLDPSHLAPPLRPLLEGADMSLQDLRRYYLYWMENSEREPWMSLFFEDANTPRMLGRLCANPLYRSILAKMLGTWLFTMRGTPVVYQGQELGLSNTRFSSADELHDMETLRQYAELCGTQGFSEQAALQTVLRHSADHARTPIPWSAGPGCGFTGAIPWMRLPDGAEHLNVACQTADPGSVWRHYQKLIALRRQHPCLVYGSFKPVFTKNKRLLCYFRLLGGQKWYVELNLSERQVPRPGRIAQNQKLVLSNYENPTRALRPYEANLYLCETP